MSGQRPSLASDRRVLDPPSRYVTTLSGEMEPAPIAMPTFDPSDPTAPLLASTDDIITPNDPVLDADLVPAATPAPPTLAPKLPPRTVTPSRNAAASESGSAAAASSSSTGRRADNSAARDRVSSTYSSVQSSALSSSAGGNTLPLLSGLPPVVESESCRTCAKKFIPLIRRPHTCQHCGYQYCGDHCSDSALMPRKAIRAHRNAIKDGHNSQSGRNDSSGSGFGSFGFGNSNGGGSGGGGGSGKFSQKLKETADEIFGDGSSRNEREEGGFDVVEVCGQCAPNLLVISANSVLLRSLPLKRLHAFCKSYNLNTSANIEKEDFVHTILRTKNRETGCLGLEAESYYRRWSVPRHGALPLPPPSTNPESSAGSSSGKPRQPKPGPSGSARDAAQKPAPPTRNQAERSVSDGPTKYGAPPRNHASSPRPQPGPAHSPPQEVHPLPVPRRTSQKVRSATPPPIPTIESLVPLPTSYISGLSIGTLKAILQDNQVEVDYTQVLEKGDIARLVVALVDKQKLPASEPLTSQETERSTSQVPELLRDGLPMLKITKKKLKQNVFRFEADGSAIRWQSRKAGRIAIDQIKEVRFGPSAVPSFQPPSIYSPAHVSRFITIVYTDATTNWKNLHLIAPSQTIFRTWLDTIALLLGNVKTVKEGDGVIGILGNKGHSGGVSGSIQHTVQEARAEETSLAEVIKICAKMGISDRPQDGIYKAFNTADERRKGYLDARELKGFMESMRRRTDIEDVYQELTIDGPMNEERFGVFMRDVQWTDMSDSEIRMLYANLLRSQDSSELGIAFDSFQSFITSQDNAFSPSGSRPATRDMTLPLSDYYISSSHNTYLLGNQWRGGSSVEGYIRALLAGCRSVEVDCWDGETEPLVYHGKTLTTPVPLRHVCEAIAKYAFMASPYPLIISAEIHCTAKSQALLVQILKETFGAALLTGPLDGFELDNDLPSPEQLKGKILFKCKRPVQDRSEDVGYDLQAVTTSATESTESDFDRASRVQRPSSNLLGRVTNKVSARAVGTPTPPVTIRSQYAPSSTTSNITMPDRSLPRRSESMDSFTSTTLVSRRSSSVARSSRQRPTIIEPLAGLLPYTAGVKFQGFSKLVSYQARDMFSVSERTAERLLRESALDFVKHNRSHLTRVYPNGTRLTSSNFQPQRFWAAGSQLVALNIQTTDLGYQINSAFFSGDFMDGYRLKPEVLRLRTLQHQLKPSRFRLTLRVISGQSLALPPGVDLDDARLSVEATVHLPGVTFDQDDLDSDTVERDSTPSSPGERWKTKSIMGNTFNPTWNHEQPLSFKVEPGLLDLCFLRLEVRHQPTIGDDVSIAVHIAGLGTLASGYRQVPLFDRQMSQFLFSTLFVKISLEAV